jgi:hypothetical protein
MYFTLGMANAYGVDLRERAVRAYRRGDGTLLEVAATFSIDPRTLQRFEMRAGRIEKR